MRLFAIVGRSFEYPNALAPNLLIQRQSSKTSDAGAFIIGDDGRAISRRDHLTRMDKGHSAEHPLASTQLSSASSACKAVSAFESENPGQT